MANQIVLGSGVLYIAPYVSATGIPADGTLEVADNLMGLIKGGASIDYKPTEYEIFDDSYAVHNRYITSEEVSFKTGILTWDVAALKKLVAKSTYVDNAGTGTRTLSLGGKAARLMDEYVIRFVHTYADGNFLRMTIVGTASNGFSLAFAPDKETIIDAEFKAKAAGSAGVQLIIEETYGEGVFYSITNTLAADIVNSNDLATIVKGAAYTGVISGVSGAAVNTVALTMGGVNIVATGFTEATGVVYIADVTGNIVITATAV